MDVPTAVEEALGDETVTERVSLKGEDALFLTPSRTIHYNSEGFLSDESVETYPHSAERIDVREKRRKTIITLDYGTDGERSFSVPGSALDDALEPIVAGVFRETGVIDPGESVVGFYRFGDLTLVVTDHRLVKHVGTAVWDEEYVTVTFADIRGLETEQGNVASQLVLKTADRTERIKTPNEGFREVDETVRKALYEYYEVPDQDAFEAAVAPEDEDESTAEEPVDETGDPTGGTAESGAGSDEVVFVSAASIDHEALQEELDELEAALDEQEATIESQMAALSKQRSRIESLRDLIEE
ncbi:MAG: hypothetical protein U5K70_06095 [Halodesulfurarchaeum sp.]|nr:hypothetical protein [Halodesulfurarchaeum sp.]